MGGIGRYECQYGIAGKVRCSYERNAILLCDWCALPYIFHDFYISTEKDFRNRRKISIGYAAMIGVRHKDMGRLYAMQSLLLFLIGSAVGIVVSISLPSFLPQEFVGTSCFALPIPFGVMVASVMICVAASLIPLLNMHYFRGNDL